MFACTFNALKEELTSLPTPCSCRSPRLHSLFCLQVRLVAARLRVLDRALLFEDRLARYARPQLEGVLNLLGDLVPCCAVYGDGHTGPRIQLGVPVERPDEPVLCLQERRVHAKAHRSARRVKGGGPDLWRRLLNVLPYNATWSGPFTPAHIPPLDARSLCEDTYELVRASGRQFTAALRALQEGHESAAVAIRFAPLEPLAAAAAAAVSAAAAAASAGGSSPDPSSVAAVVAPPGPLHLVASPLTDPLMPYCVGCGRKARTSYAAAAAAHAAAVAAAAGAGVAGDARDHAAGTSAAPAATAGSAAPAAAAVDDASYGSWVKALLSEFFPIVAAETRHMLGMDKSSGGSSASGSSSGARGGSGAVGSSAAAGAGVKFSSSAAGSSSDAASAGSGSASGVAPVRKGGLKKPVGDAASGSSGAAAAPGSGAAVASGSHGSAASAARPVQTITFGLCGRCMRQAAAYNVAEASGVGWPDEDEIGGAGGRADSAAAASAAPVAPGAEPTPATPAETEPAAHGLDAEGPAGAARKLFTTP